MDTMFTEVISQIKTAQKNELTEYYLYLKLSKRIKNLENRSILEKIADDEKRHYEFWKRYTKFEMEPSKVQITWFYWIARILGLTFGIKLMEKGEEKAQVNYAKIAIIIPEVLKIRDEEETHERELINMIEEEKLNYVGSIVLGLNDALVELTGTLAGLTFALQNTKLIAITGLITGIAAGISMAASEYLSTKAEGNPHLAVKSAIYTGLAYFVTVFLLILPYLFLPNYLGCLCITLIVALLIIFCFNYYISVAKDYSFKKRFIEMAVISMGVALLSFGIGYILHHSVGINL
jgi:vacuolar iron transporter family protein